MIEKKLNQQSVLISAFFLITELILFKFLPS